MADRAYYAKYRAEHRDKIRENDWVLYQKKREERKARALQYYYDHREEINARRRKEQS